jgi:hypothetical protein
MTRPRHFEKTNSHSAIHISLLILVLFVAIYSLSYSGTFLTDDEHILASRTFSAAFDQKINDARVYGNTRVFALSNLTPEETAAQAINIEPLQELAGLPLARLAEFLHLGLVQTIFLLNIWVVAITSVVVFGTVLIAGHSRKTALVVSLLFGLGTQAWAYTRTYFRDPLAMLFLVLAWACTQWIIRNIKRRGSGATWPAWIGLFVALTGGILAKNTITIAIPILLAEIIINTGQLSMLFHTPGKWIRRAWKTFLIFIPLALILLIIWLFVLPRIDLFARFTPAYYFFLLRFFFGTPHPKLLQALTGPFISPGKSIFLYSPILILSVISLIRHPKSAWSAWLYLGLLILGQALFFDGDWWGHRNWGLRFFLPAIPPLMIASAPVMEKWLQTAHQRVNLIVISLVSILVQVIGILPLMLNYYVDVAFSNPYIPDQATIWNPKYNPILWSMNWILFGKPFDLAAVRVGISSIPVMLGFAFIIVLVILGLGRVKWRWFAPAALVIVMSLTLLMVAVDAKDPAYYYSRKDLQAAQAMVAGQYLPGDLVLIKEYATPAWFYWMNWGDPHVPWTALPYYFPKPDLITKSQENYDPEIAMDNVTLSLLHNIPRTNTRVWLVLPADTPGADLELEATWLKNVSTSFSVWNFPGNNVETKLFLFLFNNHSLIIQNTGSGSGTVRSSPDGITCGADCANYFATGSTVTLSAMPDTGSYLLSWGAGCSGSGACKVTMNADKVVVATFNQYPYRLFLPQVNR